MLNTLPSSPESITLAVEALASGCLVILPTDTVYGICADVRADEAVRAIYRAKGKGAEAPLQLLFGRDGALIERYAVLNDAARHFVGRVGPGAWTVICPAAPGWASPALAGGTTVGIRAPASDIVLDVVDALGAPLAASSANRHGSPSPSACAAAVAEVGEACALAIDGGPTARGLDSTVIDLASASPRILREGAIDRRTVARILGLAEIPVLRSVRT